MNSFQSRSCDPLHLFLAGDLLNRDILMVDDPIESRILNTEKLVKLPKKKKEEIIAIENSLEDNPSEILINLLTKDMKEDIIPKIVYSEITKYIEPTQEYVYNTEIQTTSLVSEEKDDDIIYLTKKTWQIPKNALPTSPHILKEIEIDSDRINQWNRVLKFKLQVIQKHKKAHPLPQRIKLLIKRIEDDAREAAIHLLQTKEEDKIISKENLKEVDVSLLSKSVAKVVIRIMKEDERIYYRQNLTYIVCFLRCYYSEMEVPLVLQTITSKFELTEIFWNEQSVADEYCWILERLIESLLPRLALHFKKELLPTKLFAKEWFTSLFTFGLRHCLVSPLWDIFLNKGCMFLVKMGFYLLSTFEKKLLKLSWNKLVPNLVNMRSFYVSDAKLVKGIQLNIDDNLKKIVTRGRAIGVIR